MAQLVWIKTIRNWVCKLNDELVTACLVVEILWDIWNRIQEKSSRRKKFPNTTLAEFIKSEPAYKHIDTHRLHERRKNWWTAPDKISSMASKGSKTFHAACYRSKSTVHWAKFSGRHTDRQMDTSLHQNAINVSQKHTTLVSHISSCSHIVCSLTQVHCGMCWHITQFWQFTVKVQAIWSSITTDITWCASRENRP